MRSQKWLLPASQSLGRVGWEVPAASYLPRRLSKIGMCVWSRLLSKCCLCVGTRREYFCLRPYEWGLGFLHPLVLLNISPIGFQSQAFWRFLFLIQDPRQGPQCWSWTSCSAGVTSQLGYSSCLWVIAPGVWVLTGLPFCFSYLFCCGSSLYFWVVEYIFCYSSGYPQRKLLCKWL